MIFEGIKRGARHGRTARHVQRVRRWPQASRPAVEPPLNDHKAVSGVACRGSLQGVVSLGETLGSPWTPLAIHPCTRQKQYRTKV
jgi:hypothetical protein